MAEPTDPLAPTQTKTLGDLALEVTLPTRRDQSDLDQNGHRIGRFQLLDRLGKGGMGVVYSAYDPELDRKVALKFLHSHESGRVARERLFREAQAMAQLAHPNVATVFDVGIHQGRVFIAMQHIDGTTLKEWLCQKERSWPLIWSVFRQAAVGLAAAHDEGIVHRDFKPSNVLVDREECVHVVDFGLARSSPSKEDLDEPNTKDGPRLAQLTASGSIAGTPGYMSPEQYRGDVTDAATDQFAFCVCLYEALYKERPFTGSTLRQLAEATSSAELNSSATDDVRVPAWIRRVLIRGLSPLPADRYPSMRALIDALDHDPAAVRRRRVTTGLVLAAFGGLLALAVAGQRSAKQPCTIGPETLDDGWNTAGRTAARTSILATDLKRAKQVWAGFEAAVDTYRRSWLEQWQSACAATHLRREQSTAVLDLRMECLMTRRRKLAATIKVVAGGVQPGELDKLIPAIDDLPLPAGCANLDNLRARVPRPDDPERRDQLTSLETDVGTAEAELATGKLQLARKHLEDLAARATAVGYAPLEARIDYAMARADYSLMQYKRSEERIRHAISKAVTGGVYELETRLWLLLARAICQNGRTDEAAIALVAARAGMLRTGQPPELEARVEEAAASCDIKAGRYQSALKHMSRAVPRWETAAGPDSLALGRALTWLGRVQSWENEPTAVKNARRGLAILETKLGHYHPDVALAYRGVAAAERYSGNFAAGRDASLVAIEILTHLLGDEHPQVAVELSELAYALENLGQIAEAIRATQRALSMNEKTLGAGDRNTAVFNYMLADRLRSAGRFEEAERAARTALRIVRGYQKNKEHPDFARLETGLGWILLDRGANDEALALCTRAAAVWEKLEDPDQTTQARTCLGRARFARRERKLAVRELEAAVKAARAHSAEWKTRSAARFWLGRALWASGDRNRAKTLIQKARQAHEANKYTWDVTYKRITEWLASHR